MAHRHIGPADIGYAMGRSEPLFNTLINFRKFNVSAGSDVGDNGHDVGGGEQWGSLACQVLDVRGPIEYDVTLACMEMGRSGVSIAVSW
jgi:hypothetical protein